jgi:hypothetical protein
METKEDRLAWRQYVKRYNGEWTYLDTGNGYVPRSKVRKKSLDKVNALVVACGEKGGKTHEGENGVVRAKVFKGGNLGRWGDMAGVQVILRSVRVGGSRGTGWDDRKAG